MSAAVAWDLSPAPARVPARPSRPRLVLVPTGDVLPEREAGRLRLTRTGRLAITLTVAAAVLVLVVVALAGGAGGTSASMVDHATTVQQGQTLSQVAAEQLPQLPLAEAVAEIQVANNLPSAQVHAGQSLAIPRVG